MLLGHRSLATTTVYHHPLSTASCQAAACRSILPGQRRGPDQRWIACRPGFFLPVRILSRLFRRLFLERLQGRLLGRPASLLRRSRQEHLSSRATPSLRDVPSDASACGLPRTVHSMHRAPLFGWNPYEKTTEVAFIKALSTMTVASRRSIRLSSAAGSGSSFFTRWLSRLVTCPATSQFD